MFVIRMFLCQMIKDVFSDCNKIEVSFAVISLPLFDFWKWFGVRFCHLYFLDNLTIFIWTSKLSFSSWWCHRVKSWFKKNPLSNPLFSYRNFTSQETKRLVASQTGHVGKTCQTCHVRIWWRCEAAVKRRRREYFLSRTLEILCWWRVTT